MAQSAVSLVAADGETITGGVQSNFAGNGFYTRNGFTRAANWTAPNPLGGEFAGFDDPNFLPICTWLTDFSGTGFYARMDDLGVNGMLPAAGSITLANNITYEKWAVVTAESHAAGTISTGDDPGVVGVSTGEEPSTVSHYEQIIDDADAWLDTAEGAGRFHLFNFADPLLNGDMENVYYPDDMVTGAQGSPNAGHDPHQFTTCDQYWFAGAPDDAGGSRTKLHSRLYDQPGSATENQCARGSHYGSMFDSIRKQYTLPANPTGVWIENGAPYTETTSAAITPAQLKWAVWSTLVHGARSIHYFNHTFRTGDPNASSNNLGDDAYGGPGVAGTGIYAATKEVNLRALEIAPAINGPFDGYFVYGDDVTGAISTSGFLTAVTSTNTRDRYSGVDASCKWNPEDSTHYILATTREAGSATNIPITCRMVDQGQTTATPVFGGSALTISRGGDIPDGFCEFTDTFATAADYKCWRIETDDNPGDLVTRPLVNLQATWRDSDSLRSGTAKIILPTRITNSEDEIMYPAGTYWSGALTVVEDGVSLDVDVPATDDPAIAQTGWLVKVVVNFDDLRSEVYNITVPYANRSVDDGGNGDGVNLRDYALPSQIPASSPAYAIGVAGGLAQLNEDGDVIDANGDPVTGGGGGGAVDSVNGETGVVVLDKSDVGLGNVDNTSDASKPVSTATTTALAGKANTSHAHAASDVTSGTLAVARIGSGTAAAGTYVDGGTGAWTVLPEAPDVFYSGVYPVSAYGFFATSVLAESAENTAPLDPWNVRLFVPAGQVITRAGVCITTAGSGISGLAGFGLYDDSGNLVTSTANDASVFESTGYRFKDFPTPVAAQGSDRFVWLRAVVETGTKPVVAFRVANSNVLDGGLTTHRRAYYTGGVSSWASTISPLTDGSANGGYIPLMGLG